MEARPTAAADPRPSRLLMILGYVVGGIGLALGFSEGASEAIEPVALWSVGLLGIVSFVRHSIFHRSDAARMKWDLGRTNNFQIEVGMANLAWGLAALAAVIWDWGVAAQAGITLVFGLYLLQTAVLHIGILVRGPQPQRRSPGPALATTVMAGALIAFGLAALANASIAPF